MNFGEELMKDDMSRVVNGLQETGGGVSRKGD